MDKGTGINQFRTGISSINLRDNIHIKSNFHIGSKQTWGDQGSMQNRTYWKAQKGYTSGAFFHTPTKDKWFVFCPV